MASYERDDLKDGNEHIDRLTSANQWRHQESREYRACNQPQVRAANGRDKAGLDAVDRHVGEQNTNRMTDDGTVSADGMAAQASLRTDGNEVRCGPLLNYRHMEGSTWHGSVLIVLGGGIQGVEFVPELIIRRVSSVRDGSIANALNGTNCSSSAADTPGITQPGNGKNKVMGVKLYANPGNAFWRFNINVEMGASETQWEYTIPGLRFTNGRKTDKQSFFVPAVTESFRVMFHSCNGFSVGTDEDAYSGTCLWNDVIRVHAKTPFHVMIGGGDQIYNDGITVDGPLRQWANIGNPKKRREYPFPGKLRKECDDYYVANYIRWYSTEPFANANGQIAQLNIWDDHDIIDGFGSYVNEFMKCEVFRGIGGAAYKYYLLFQHHIPPPVSTYTTDAPQTMEAAANGVGRDPAQMKDTYVLENEPEEPSYIIGRSPGPYVAERSRSIYTRLGARMAFFGIDARTERTRHQINYPDTYDLIFGRLHKELYDAANSPSPIQHMIVLLSVPIAYPRFTWLEKIFPSPIMAPIKLLNKKFGLAGGFINYFDGSVDLLDDLNDHYTARKHKKERRGLMLRMQDMAAKFSVRITILSGDVHLAAVGRFYSSPKLEIPVANDHRYMVNIISSAIVNAPPPSAVANLLARRNKLHHLDENTDETLLKFFNKDPGEDHKTADHNKVTMPARNWAMITENSADNVHATANGQADGISTAKGVNIRADQASGKDGHYPLAPGEVTAGSESRAASDRHGMAGDGSLDVCIRVEKNQHDAEGRTQTYGMWVPALKYDQRGCEF
ncbi:hypothetical protein DL98DRAFT_636663 [Cadophora sp. DSE1049]|nr:hypothetical protein DL98DRAFT_636663 [Cadophora sp. DSE1049]